MRPLHRYVTPRRVPLGEHQRATRLLTLTPLPPPFSTHACLPVTSITFLTETGDVPLLTLNEGSLAGGQASIHTHATGTREFAECSNRGVYDGTTGKCKCAEGYGSSDGQNNPGRLGDCGHLHALEGSKGKYAVYK